MADPNLVDFYSRVARFERARSHGYGFDAAGTLGRSHFARKPLKRRSLLGPLLIVACASFGLKGAILHSVGAASYDSRVERLQAGEGFDRLGGWLMQADPVTLFVADKIADGLTRMKG
jgi:hypothetical protein